MAANDKAPPFGESLVLPDDWLELVSKVLLRVQKADPQGLKPAFLADPSGTAEAVPCPKPNIETSSTDNYRLLISAVFKKS
jgi:hypothetical protein